MSQLKIKYTNLNDIKLLEMNFKNHDISGVEKSLIRYGFVDPVGVNPATGNAYDGNGRTKVLIDMRRRWLQGEKIDPPSGIVVKGKDWFVPTIEKELSETDEIALASALNRLNELGGYDEEKMLEVLQYLQSQDALEDSAFTNDDLALLLETLNQTPPTLDELKDKHGSTDNLDEFSATFNVKLSLTVHSRLTAIFDVLSGTADERITRILDGYEAQGTDKADKAHS